MGLLSSEGKNLMETSHLARVFQGLSLSEHCPVVGLYICSHLLQEEASLTMAEQDTDVEV